jgi:UDP-N-acetylmuramoyl-L-alanyl-D-glutamate--2,6-diaminopimelate ligase
MPRALSELLRDVSVLELSGPPDAAVEGLAYDSRAVRQGFLFFALPGLHADGHRFIRAAVEAGAAAVLHSAPVGDRDPRVAYVRVADPRAAMSPVAAAFYGRPSRSLGVIGITGTEGKSTTVYLAYQLLCLAGRRAGFFSTVMSDTGKGEAPNPEHQTTPEATAVQRMLAEMRDAGMGFAVVEASSHGLSPRTNRLGDVGFDVGVMTNVTSEHLEFHGTWEAYRDDKARLFRSLRPGGLGVVNADDPSAEYFRAAAPVAVRSFSAAGGAADLSARALSVDPEGESFEIVEAARGAAPERVHAVRADLPGAFNVGNVLAALLAVSHIASIEIADLVPLVPRLRPVRGRMTTIDRGQSFEVVVDYAHTPSSFETVFPPLRRRVAGRMICVFGSGGERDTQKRPRQGRIAADWFDVVILADEDPRGEDPMELLEEIAAGCPELPRGERLYLIPDRPTAIRKAFSLAREGDLVALLGKGHENSIIGKDGPVPYDEIREAEAALREMGFDRQGDHGGAHR